MTTTTEPSASGADAASLDKIAEEHKALADSLERLEKTTDLHLVLPRIEKLKSQLEHHFESEEASGELRSDVRRNAPYLLGSLEQIFDEHRQFLGDVDTIREKTRTALDGVVAEILQDISALARRLRDHEARETDLIQDVYCTDYGDGAD